MRFLLLAIKLAVFAAMSGVALATSVFGGSLNQHGLASTFAKEPVAAGQFIRPLWEAFASESATAWLATAMTLMIFVGVWFICHEAINARHLAREHGRFTRSGDTEKAAMARMVMQDAKGWALLLAVPVGILLCVDYYLLSRYTEVERAWLSIGIALIGPLMFAYCWDRAAVAWDALRSLGAEYWKPVPAAGPAQNTPPVGADAPLKEQAAASTVDQPVQESPHIEVSASELPVPRDGQAELSWSITGARSAVLSALARSQELAVPLTGRLVIAAALEEESFDLTAVGAGGDQQTRRLRVIPHGLAINEPLHELKFLAASWR
jgi:hypothetical protein